MRKILKGYRLDVSTFTPVMKCLIEACWNHNLHERPSFQVILSTLSHCKEEIMKNQTMWFSRNKQIKKKKRESKDDEMCTDFGSLRSDDSCIVTMKKPSHIIPLPPATSTSSKPIITSMQKMKHSNILTDLEISCREKKNIRRHSSDERNVDKFSPTSARTLRKYDNRRRPRVFSLPTEIIREEYLARKNSSVVVTGKSLFKVAMSYDSGIAMKKKKEKEKPLGAKGRDFYRASIAKYE